MITYQRCEYCDGKIGVTSRGARADIHKRRECPGLPPTYVPRDVTVDDRLDELERALVRLEQDLHDAGRNLDALARSDWPAVPSANLITAEMTLRQQFGVLQTLAEILVAGFDCQAAMPLALRVGALLEPGFTAPRTELPERIIVPPLAVQLAMERLGFTRAPDDALLARIPPFDPALARDWRLARFWLSQQDS